MIVKDVKEKLPKKGEYPTRGADLTTIDIHHSASPQDNYTGFGTIVDFANQHINQHGWPGIGYHYVISPDGIVWKTGYVDEMRWSVGGNNSYTISIMLIGNLHKEDPTEIQYKNAVELAAQMINAYGVGDIRGHNEFAGHESNICPGIDMNKFRNDVKKRVFYKEE